MMRARVMPCLLLTGDGTLVKTVQFRDRNYIGDPVNTVSIFNDLEVDEIVVLDIDASKDGRAPQFDLLKEIAENCFIPMAYGGGVRTIDQMKALFQIGIEKVVLNSALVDSPDLVSQASNQFGMQAIVASIDVKKNLLGGYRVFDRLGKHPGRAKDPVIFAKEVQSLGAGEILLNSVDRDGTFKGFDLDLLKLIAPAVDVPLIACGGAKNFRDLRNPVLQAGASAVAAGSVFVYQNESRSVLVSFPTQSELKEIFAQ